MQACLNHSVVVQTSLTTTLCVLLVLPADLQCRRRFPYRAPNAAGPENTLRLVSPPPQHGLEHESGLSGTCGLEREMGILETCSLSQREILRSEACGLEHENGLPEVCGLEREIGHPGTVLLTWQSAFVFMLCV